MTTIPRWISDPVPGADPQNGPHSVYAEYEVPLDATLLRSASFESALLAAHAKVLAALSGEREVTTGYVAVKGQPPVARRMLVGPGSWQELLALTDLADEVGGADEPPYETVLDPHGGELADDGAVLYLSVGEHTLRLRHRTDVLDAEAAARIAGYHLTALSLMAADPDADHEGQSLLSGAELAFQLDGLAGRTVNSRTAGCTSCSRSGSGSTRTRSRPCRAARSGPTVSSTPGRTRSVGRCWPVG